MALDQSDLSELLAALRTGDSVDLVRDLVRLVVQELVEAEATQVIGAGRYERSEARVTERNGRRAKTLSTKAGDIEVGIPKLRRGSFFPSIMEPRRRIDQALYAVVMEAYVKGVSTRSVDDLVAALGVSSGISRSEVSRICAQLDVEVEAFRSRGLGHARFPYLYLDATYLHVRDDHHVDSPDFIVRTGQDIYVVETKAQHSLSDENVKRKERAAVAWCEQINDLEPSQRDDHEWHYVLIGESIVREWHSKNERASQLLDYARLRRVSTGQGTLI